MANPQKEDGYTPIANELLEAVLSCYLSSYEKDVILAIMRKTYGWGKKKDWVAASQLADMTGIPRPHITRTVKKLKDKKIVTQTGNSIGIQKDYDEWKVEWRKLPKQVTGVTQTGNKKLPKQVHTKEKKETNKNYPAEPEESMHYEIVKDLEVEKKVKTPSRAKDITAVFRLFKNPAAPTWVNRPVQREAALVLFDTYGLEVLERRLKIIEEEMKKGDPLFPLVTTPAQLLDKMPSVERYLNV